MTYLGGQGIEYKNDGTKYYLPSQIAKDLNTIWLDYIRANTQNTTDVLRTKPWGWVMLNRVGTEPTTSWCIEAVIRHNADPVFKHQRRSEKQDLRVILRELPTVDLYSKYLSPVRKNARYSSPGLKCFK